MQDRKDSDMLGSKDKDFLDPLLNKAKHHEIYVQKKSQDTECGVKTTTDSILENNAVDTRITESKWTALLVFVCFSTTLGTAVPGGYALGVLNNPAMHMRKWCNESLIERFDIHLSMEAIDVLWSAIVSIILIGGVAGAFTGGWMADKFGRKTSLFVCGVLYLNAGGCFYGCVLFNSIEILCLGRLIVGLASGLASTCLPMYLSEIAPLALRGTLGACCPAGFTTGLVLAQFISLENVFGSEAYWHIALCSYAIFVLIYLVPYSYYPESPKWLFAIKDDTKAAEAALIRLRGVGKMQLIASELENMKLEASGSEQSSTFKEVVTDPKLRLPLILLCIYVGGQQLAGSTAIFSYSVLIFRKAGFTAAAAERANLGLGILGFVTIFLCLVLVTKFNRRPLMLLTSFCCFLALFMFGIFLHFIERYDWCAVGCIIAIFAHILFLNMGVGPIPIFIGSELFEVGPRSAAMSIGSLLNFGGAFIACMSFPSLQNFFGALIFVPLSLNFLIIFLFTYVYLPETRGRDSVEIALLVSKGFKSKVR